MLTQWGWDSHRLKIRWCSAILIWLLWHGFNERELRERERREKKFMQTLKKFKSHFSSVTIITQNVYYGTVAQTSIPCTTRKARKMCLMPQRYQIDHYYKRAQNWYYMS